MYSKREINGFACWILQVEYGNLRLKIEDVILESKEGQSDGLPHLVYISREKRPEHPHNYKAGAMNVLTRVSGLMSNAPYILNVDCDMMVNNPKIVRHAMCIFMDPEGHKEVAFVQCFQQFFDGLKDDPFGNQWVAAFETYSSTDIVSPSKFLEAAHHVATCGYEYGTAWGEVGGQSVAHLSLLLSQAAPQVGPYP
ncbi:hypothetical protein K1719_026822 [Acacia pycnantha]|nr:hypothetical protein K1719_026822 [Acacia pycnantha]